jgi:hypothetical protein
MKYIALLLLVVLVALPACGASPLKDKLSLSISALQINNTDLRDFLGTPLGFTMGYKLTEEGNMETGISIGYFTANHDATLLEQGALGTRAPIEDLIDYKMTTIPVMLTQRWKFGAGKGFRPYLGYGFGFNWTQQKIDMPYAYALGRDIMSPFSGLDSTTRMMGAAQITAGAAFGNGYFVDLKYVSGTEDITTGYTVSLGKSF